MEKFKQALKLFLTFFKIGLFTFGGGYAMISLIENECIEQKKWITNEEFLNCVALAESTPGPIAINSATYIGYKVAGFLGSLFATLGVILPSFVIIFLISLFFNNLLEIEVIANAFKGIKVGVSLLIISAGIKMFIKAEKKPIPLIIIFTTIVVMVLIDIFSINFSSIFLILIGAVVGLIVYCINQYKEKQKPIEHVVSNDEKEVDKDEHLS
ncbi:MAG: chromate transporter [Clostridiales bacterium]|nr:chromate transporter [Clostridiales bacterium]